MDAHCTTIQWKMAIILPHILEYNEAKDNNRCTRNKAKAIKISAIRESCLNGCTTIQWKMTNRYWTTSTPVWQKHSSSEPELNPRLASKQKTNPM